MITLSFPNSLNSLTKSFRGGSRVLLKSAIPRTVGIGMMFLFLQLCASVWGQGFLYHDDPHYHLPRPHLPPINRSYRIKEISVDASIANQIATTQVTQIFENTGSVQIEATFLFPLPYDGAVDKMTFMVDGQEIEAQLMPKDKARSIYEGYLRRNQDPALLEWMGNGMFRSSVFPIPVGQSRTITLRYSQLLRKDHQAVDYVFPLSTAKYTSQPLDKLSFRVAIQSDEDLKNIFCPTHEIKVERDDSRHAVVRHTSEKVVPANDFRMVYDSEKGKVGVSLLSYWPNDEDQGYFALLASPDIKSAVDQNVRKTVIFVVDQSGSMSGPKIDQAREAAKFVLQNLHENDLFNIIRYESDVTMMAPELQAFNNETRQSALGFVNSINSGGSTNINGALQEALKLVTNLDTPTYLVFLTDGLPTVGETKELAIAQNCREANRFGARLISFGVGYDVNSRLLDRLSRENHGQSEYVRPDENIESVVANLYKKISSPVLANLKINFEFPGTGPSEGDIVNRAYPKEATDLFADSQVVIIGRYKKAGEAKIRLEGDVNKQHETHEFTVNFSSKGQATNFAFVRQIWAARRIGEIIDVLDLKGSNDELVRELVELSIRYGIVTPYTAYLADENQKRNQLSDNEFNYRNSQMSLKSLEEASGQSGFGQRAAKQHYKNADKIASADSAPSFSIPDPTNQQTAAGGQPGQSLEGRQLGHQGLRRIGNTTIYQRGNLLVVDNAIKIDVEQDKNIIKIKRFSDEYFKLVQENQPEENQILSQQGDKDELLVVLRGQAYLIN